MEVLGDNGLGAHPETDTQSVTHTHTHTALLSQNQQTARYPKDV